MSNLNEKLAAAKAAYAQARKALEKKRNVYESGAGKAYAEVKKNLTALKNQIEQHEQAHQEAQQALADAMKASNGAKTEAVRKALSERRSAEDLIAECQALLRQAEENSAAVRRDASIAGMEYKFAYEAATQCWVEMSIAAVFADCGERLCSVLATRPAGRNIGALVAEQEKPRNVFVTELDRLLSSYEGDTSPYTSELGQCDLGALSTAEIMSPVEIAKARSNANVHSV